MGPYLSVVVVTMLASSAEDRVLVSLTVKPMTIELVWVATLLCTQRSAVYHGQITESCLAERHAYLLQLS
jgi:hypothetical protein